MSSARTVSGSRSGATFVLVAACLLALPGQAMAQRAAPVTLTGTGSWGVHPEMADWAAALSRARSPVALTYTPRGSGEGRAAFLRGETDFVVSGVEFTAAEKAELTRTGREVVKVPIQAAALAILLRPPVDGLTQAMGGKQVPYRGPVRMPPGTVARSILSDANTWNDPEFTKALGVRLRSYPAGVEPVLRSDPTETNYYLGQYLRTVAPDLWKATLAGEKLPPDHLSEAWPVPAQAVQPGLSEVVTAVADRPSGAPADGGTIGLVPLWAVGDARTRFPQMDLRVVQLQNGSGEWVEPTPGAVTAALATGGGSPLSGLTAPAAGAYPLSWVDYLYVAKTGLAPEKADALAAFIRYAVTAGRASTETHGDAGLPDFLVAQSLRAADTLVVAGCTGPGVAVVTTSDAGPYAPSGSGSGPMLRCERPIAPAPAPPPETGPPVPAEAPPAATATEAAVPAREPAAPLVPPEPAGPPLGSAMLPLGDPVQIAPDAPDGLAPQAAGRTARPRPGRPQGTFVMSAAGGRAPFSRAGLLLAAPLLVGAVPALMARRTRRTLAGDVC